MSRAAVPALLACLLFSTLAQAAPDEIQVYDDEMDAPGTFGLEVHANYVVSGSTEPAYPGATPTNHVMQVTPESSWGISEHFEAGMYFPPIAITPGGTVYSNGLRLRLKYMATEPGKEGLFWGLNTEFGYFSTRVAEAHWGGELRPILGYRADRLTAIINPILDFSVSGDVSRVPQFEPAVKLSWDLTPSLAVGVEGYAAMGPVNNHLLPWNQQDQSAYAVVDWKSKYFDLDLGVGKGNAQSEDKTIVKMIVALPL